MGFEPSTSAVGSVDFTTKPYRSIRKAYIYIVCHPEFERISTLLIPR